MNSAALKRWFFLGLCLPVVVHGASALRVARVECDNAIDPLGVDDGRPRLSWQLASDERAQRQTAWQVLVATSAEKLAADEGDLWDSGQVKSANSVHLRYLGAALGPAQQVWWKVRAWDQLGQPTAWSEPATWTMGLREAADWKGGWITSAERHPTTLLRTEFTVRPGLRRAIAFVSGLGEYELSVNGAKNGRDVLAQGWTDFAETVLYDTRDLTSQLVEGRNALGLTLADGMFNVYRPEGRFAKFIGSFGAQRARLQLRLDYADGSVDLIGSDETWRGHAGADTFAGMYGGEDFDARLVQKGWDQPGFDDSSWAAAVAIDGPGGVMRGHSVAPEPVVPIETREPVAVKALTATTALYDFGQNTSFIPRLQISGPAGSVVRLTGGEVVNADGTINRSTMGGAHRGSAWWQYTKATDEPETWFPQFYYLGSRYLYAEFTAGSEGGTLPKIDDVQMVIVHSAAAAAGHFESSSDTLNQIRDLVRWAQRSNMMSILTDCPHREKLGWLEQTHLNGPALRFEWDLDRLAAKQAHDMADAQTADGLIPNIAPEYTVFKGTFRAAAEWGAAFIMVPWQQYLFTGDETLLRELYPRMQRYFSYLESKAAGGLLSEGLGDWYDQVLGKPGRANLTPPKVTATAFYFQDAKVLGQIAGMLGLTDDAAIYAAKAEAIRATYNAELFKPDTPELYGTGTQTSMALPLVMGMVEPANRERVQDALVAEVTSRNFFQSGAAGIRFLLRALAEAGRSDLIFKIATNPEMPGYAYQLTQGNTAMAESWTAQLGASQNHFFLGQIVEWMYADLAGIGPDEAAPGFAHIKLQPTPIAALDWVEASHDTVRGPIAVRWDRVDGRLHYRVEIPANTTATLRLPARDEAILESGEPVGGAVGVVSVVGVKRVGREGDYVTYTLESGSYEFESTW